jgi:asparagine synthase (glutamine-hydrolysing)
MCGICGIWPGARAEKAQKMVSAMRHRGPDDYGIYSDDQASLGMSRLAILDITPAGHQPMTSRNENIWIVYNGETYNFPELRTALEKDGHSFKSNSDTEVVLQLYEKYGDDFLTRMRGMFALAIYDKRGGPGHEKLLIARDHLGIKPLLYSGDAHHFVFASELKALLASGLVERKIDIEALQALLAFGSVPQPSTILAGVKMLMPGHRLIIKSGRLTIERFWNLETNRFPELYRLGYDDQVRYMRTTLEKAIGAHMVSDVPVGAFLSGGIDSTILVALMARASHHKVRTFSVGFGQEGHGIDESDDAALAAAFIGTKHERVLINGQNVRDQLLELAAGLDQPSVDGLNSYFVSAAAARKVKVAISGTGGDELFAGYPWFAAMADMARRMRRLNGQTIAKQCLSKITASRYLDKIPGYHAARVISRIRASGDLLSFFARQYQIFGSYRAQNILVPDIARNIVPISERQYISRSDELGDADIISRVSAICLRGYTQNQLLRDIDAVSMKHSIEVRVPFIDTLVTDIALSLPGTTKLFMGSKPGIDNTCRHTGAKRILIDSVRDLLPPDLDQRPKRGFTMPYDAWMRGPLQDVMEDTLNSKCVASRGLFKVRAVEGVRQQFYRGKTNWSLPWLLMMIELWFRQVIDPTSSYQNSSGATIV